MSGLNSTPQTEASATGSSTESDTESGLKTENGRRKFYRQKLNLVEPQEVYLGITLVKHRGKIISQRKFGVIVPFERNLKALLAMPEVWHYVQHVHTSNDSVMRDMCDGYVWSANELFSRNPSAPQIFLNTDDIEVVNPIGAHVRKHHLLCFILHLEIFHHNTGQR